VSARNIGSSYKCRRGKMRNGASVTVAGALKRAVEKMHLGTTYFVQIYNRASGKVIAEVSLDRTVDGRTIHVDYLTKKQYV